MRSPALTLVGVLAAAALAGCQQPAPPPPADADTRTAIELPAEMHQAALREMRQMLMSIGGVTTAAAAGDTTLLQAAAAAAGTATAVDPAIDSLVPPEWKAFAARAHGAFDSLAAAVRLARTPQAVKDTVLVRIGTLVGNCTGCHETYHMRAR